MTSLTERYLAAALRGIPEAKRKDVERELRSSIADAVEDHVEAGRGAGGGREGRPRGPRRPRALAAEYAGRPLHLIGPELFVVWRHVW